MDVLYVLGWCKNVFNREVPERPASESGGMPPIPHLSQLIHTNGDQYGCRMTPTLCTDIILHAFFGTGLIQKTMEIQYSECSA